MPASISQIVPGVVIGSAIALAAYVAYILIRRLLALNSIRPREMFGPISR